MYDTLNMVRVVNCDRQAVEERAKETGVHLTDKHWEAIDFIQKFYDYHENEALKVSDYNNALQGKYSLQGGLKYLYTLFPHGPVKTITELTGISVNNIQDQSMGSVH